MAFANVTEEQFTDLLSASFTPSATIKTPERLFGRQKALKTIERAFASQGRQVFIYGDRGVGKTSLAQTAAFLHNSSEQAPIYVLCGNGDSFGNILKAVGNAVIDVKSRFETPKGKGTFGGSAMGFGANFKPGDAGRANVAPPESINDALDIIRYVISKRSGRQIIIIDEMERITDDKEKNKFAEFIKNVPEIDGDVKFIFCGIATTVDELIGAHPSAGRIIETINLEKLHHNYLWEIIDNVAKDLSVKIRQEILIRIGQVSDGFPHYVHLIGESLFWNAHDEETIVSEILPSHYREGVKGAIQRAEATLRQQYDKATRKTKNTEDYEEALWALADSNSDSRQLTEIFDASYRRIMASRPNRPILTREKFNHRLLALRKEGHGNVVKGYGSGWFGFRENILRGYVRLRAEGAGVQLGQEIRRND